MWTLAAASRREFETAFEAPSLVEAAVPVENTLTYTPPPSFFDEFNLMAQEVMRFVTKVTGFNVHLAIGSLMAMDTPPFFLGYGSGIAAHNLGS